MSAVITGAGAVTPRGPAVDGWRQSAPSAGAVLPVDDLPDAVRARLARVERVTQLALVAAGTALGGAGLLGDGAVRPHVGVVLGTAFGCLLTNAAYQERLVEGGVAGASPRLFAATVSNAAAGEVGIAYRLGGPAITLTAGAASGAVALAHAVDLVAEGRVDAVVAGGMDALGPAVVRFLADGGLAVGRPAAEAAAAVVVEHETSARRRAAPLLGRLLGGAVGFDAAPDGGRGLAAAIRTALAEARVSPAAIRLVVSGAPPARADLEARALAAALGARHPAPVVPKDVLGETFGAAGVLGVLAALAEAPPQAAALVLDLCPSGHVAALVAQREGGA